MVEKVVLGIRGEEGLDLRDLKGMGRFQNDYDYKALRAGNVEEKD